MVVADLDQGKEMMTGQQASFASMVIAQWSEQLGTVLGRAAWDRTPPRLARRPIIRMRGDASIGASAAPRTIKRPGGSKTAECGSDRRAMSDRHENRDRTRVSTV